MQLIMKFMFFDISMFFAYLTNGEYGHSGSYSVFLDNTIRSNSTDDHTDTAHDECDHEQRPSHVHTREDVTVKQISVICETETSCNEK